MKVSEEFGRRNSKDRIQNSEWRKWPDLWEQKGRRRLGCDLLEARVEAGKTTFTPKAKMNEILRIHGLLS
jgi:hypothetical protein